MGLLCGACFGGVQVAQVFVNHTGPTGVVIALLSGVPFGVVMGLSIARTPPDDSGLSRTERFAVRKAVRLGEAPADPSLATAVVERARKVQAENTKLWPYLVLVAFAVLTVVIVVADGSVSGSEMALIAFWAVALPLVRWYAVRSTERARRAEEAARGTSSPGDGA